MPYGSVSIVQDAGILVGNKARYGPQVARIEGDRIKGGMLDRCDAGIRLAVRITQISLIHIPTAAEIAVDALAGIIIESPDAGFEAIWIYSQSLCKRPHALSRRQASALDVLAERQRKGFDRSEAIFPQKTPVADQIGWN